MEIKLNSEIISQLSSKGVLAYVAVSLGEGSEATTAALAGLVKAHTGAMLEGLKELATAAPELVAKAPKNRWRCGVIKAGAGVLQNLDSERYRLFVDDLKKYWDFLNPTLPFQMGGRDGTQIRRFLADHPDWTQNDWRKALQNRKDSVVVHGKGSRSDELWCWIGSLGTYAAGPIDKFKNQVDGNGKAEGISNRNRQGNEEYLSRL